MLDIRIKTCPKLWLRNKDDCADWYTKKGIDEIRVANQKNTEYEMLIATHEMWEQYLCRKNGISQKEVDEWDRNNKLMGDDKKAPYHSCHVMATKIEKYAAKLLGINWKQYEESL